MRLRGVFWASKRGNGMPESFEDDEADGWVSLGAAVEEALLNCTRAAVCLELRSMVLAGLIPVRKMTDEETT